MRHRSAADTADGLLHLVQMHKRGETADAAEHSFDLEPVGDAEELAIWTVAPTINFFRELHTWKLEPSDNFGLIRASNPTKVSELYDLKDESCPTVLLIAALKDRGWTRCDCFIKHTPPVDGEEAAKLFSAVSAESKSAYYRCLLVLDELWANGGVGDAVEPVPIVLRVSTRRHGRAAISPCRALHGDLAWRGGGGHWHGACRAQAPRA